MTCYCGSPTHKKNLCKLCLIECEDWFEEMTAPQMEEFLDVIDQEAFTFATQKANLAPKVAYDFLYRYMKALTVI